MATKCVVDGVRLSPCGALQRAIEYGNPKSKSKGLFSPHRVNMRTGEKSPDVVQVHSGEFIGGGVAVNFCPFCGEKIVTWGENHGE